MTCILAIFFLAVPATAIAEKPSIGTPDIKINGDTPEDAELTVTVAVTGEDITEVLLAIQPCTDTACLIPVYVEMESVGSGQYMGTYSEFEGSYEYYQYWLVAENSGGESQQNDYAKLKGLPGYEDNETDDDDSTSNDDIPPENDTDENDDEDSTGFEIVMVIGSVILLGVFFRKK
jgi:hypothetical protein